jgi:transposase
LDTDPTFGVFFMAKYTEQFKLSVVKDFEARATGSRDIARRHGIDESTVRKWVAVYRVHGEAGIRKKYGRNSAAFKQFVLQQMRLEGLSIRETAARFNIRNADAIAQWARRYDAGGVDALSARPRGRPGKMPEPSTVPPMPPDDDDRRSRQELLDELNHLRMENAYLKKLEALAQAQHAARRKKRKSCSS